MFRSSTLLGAFVACLLAAGSLGCNRKCDKKEDKPPVDLNDFVVKADLANFFQELCKVGSDEGTTMCNHTAVIPAGVFSDGPVNVMLKYTSIELDNEGNELYQNNRGLATASFSFKYKNFTITVEDSDSKVIIHPTDNQFEITFTLKLPTDEKDEPDCFFQWNNIQVVKFESSKTSFGPTDKTRQIIAKFEKDQLQMALNSKPMMDLLNKEMSVCNKESFLNTIMAGFFFILAFKGIVGNIIDNIFCT